MIGDILFHTRFGDDYLIEDISFLNFTESDSLIISSDTYPVDIPQNICLTMQDATFVVKRAFVNGKMVSYSNDELLDVNIIVETKTKEDLETNYSFIDYFNIINEIWTRTLFKSFREIALSIQGILLDG